MEKCLWCGKVDEKVGTQKFDFSKKGKFLFAVHPQHSESLFKYYESQHRLFMITQLVLGGLSLGLIFLPLYGALIFLTLIGFVLIASPTPPLGLSMKIGVLRARSLVQAVGVTIFLVAIFCILLLGYIQHGSLNLNFQNPSGINEAVDALDR